MNLIRTLIIEQHGTCRKKASTAFTTGLMIEPGIHWDVLLVEQSIQVG